MTRHYKKLVERFEEAVKQYTWRGSYSGEPALYEAIIQEYHEAKDALLNYMEKKT